MDARGANALHLAAKLHDTRLLHFFCEKFIKRKLLRVNFKDKEGKSPLHYALTRDAVVVLLAFDADPFQMDVFGRDSITQAAFRGRREILEKLIYSNYKRSQSSSLEFVKTTANKRLPLVEAVISGSIECILLLLESGVDVNAIDCNGKSAILIAIELNNVTAVEVLLQAPFIDLKREDKHGATPIAHAMCSGSSSLLTLLYRYSPELFLYRNSLGEITIESAFRVAQSGNSEDIENLISVVPLLQQYGLRISIDILERINCRRSSPTPAVYKASLQEIMDVNDSFALMKFDLTCGCRSGNKIEETVDFRKIAEFKDNVTKKISSTSMRYILNPERSAKLCESESDCDLVLRCADGRRVFCHRAVISVGKFLAMLHFRSQCQNEDPNDFISEELELFIPDAEYAILCDVVRFLYTGVLSSSQSSLNSSPIALCHHEHFVSLLMFADYYLLENLKRKCEEELQRSLIPSKAYMVFVAASSVASTSLAVTAIYSFFSSNHYTATSCTTNGVMPCSAAACVEMLQYITTPCG